MRVKSSYRKIAALAVAMTVTLGSAWPAPLVHADMRIGKTIAITSQSYFVLEQLHLTASQNGKTAILNIHIHNGGDRAMKVIDYWLRLTNKSGSQFPVRMLPSDLAKTHVAPGSTTKLTYYATVNENTQVQDLIVEFMKWEFNQPNFERSLGAVAVPETYKDVTPSHETSVLRIGETDMQASIKKLISHTNEKYHVPNVFITLENSGSHTAKLPEYQYSIRTPDGLLYPLEPRGAKDVVIKPKEKKDIELSGTIPIAVDAGQWELVLTESVPDLPIKLQAGAFQLPEAALNQKGSLGTDYTFTTKDGVYTARMNAMSRFPWEDRDLLSANLSLGNTGTDALPIPNLTGYFLLDDKVKIEAKAIQTTDVANLDAQTSAGLQMVAALPYRSEFSRVKLVLQEKESETLTTDVLELSGDSELQPIPFHDSVGPYQFAETGRSMDVRVRSLSRYTSNTGSLVLAQVEATNLEQRYSALTKLAAQFRGADGTLLPASVADVAQRISPEGTALLQVAALVPKGFSTENMQLILGQSVTEGKLSAAEDKPDAYVNPVAFRLPEAKSSVQDSLKKVSLYPYEITLNHFSTSINLDTFTFKFDYEITREKHQPVNMDGHKLVLVFEDGGGEKSFERSFELKDVDPVDGETPETIGTKLKMGKHENFTIQITDPDFIYKSSYLKKYKLSLYEEVQGQRKLLATQYADWFTKTD
ncbi:hypothetical protein [Paenibacillus puerhi]|uniref:hypothetical protein n=1 Tax=Paenibacillus puerhi TaxID=2692622 RepID=UPI0013595538|nr:hypothetical protein [Paenibacillus puerhi]